MNLAVMLLLVGFSYIVLFGGLSLFRREGLSARFAVEAVALTLLASGLTAAARFVIHPVVLLLLLYLVTMRVRLLVDIGNIFAQRGQFARADRWYNLAVRLWPDQTGALIVQVNRGTALLQQGNLDAAIDTFTHVLKAADQGFLGVKYEAATHYNLGVAYRRKQIEAHAVVEFNAAIDTWPASIYARRAEAALERNRLKQ